ncbi:MAG: CPBP family intramembrane metalloprotease [Ignavibacteria bacterium]|jgi:membrane protease YdiL (CAAX protease family)|nr:CPBP family intramembrane metalloprotease [Ignavibacteria bacterium]MCU7504384.1 CPBP family intramembrane metalloprotease [Ignavibacteria bacterium]MCU7517607.1 CPBP family intramembrane metalloprotease [Ignavibacteria bacterium]
MKVKPISILKSIWFFVISSAIIYSGLYYGIPFLQSNGIPVFFAYLIVFHIPLFLLIITALIFYRIEGHPMNLQAFKERIWLSKMDKKDWLWTAGLFTLGISAYLLLAPAGKSLAQIGFLAPPDFFPAEINPTKIPRDGYIMDYKLSGQYWIAIIYFIAVVTNVLGEEFLFRGMILRRQIVKYGNRAWLYHGVIWTLWHFFWKWNLISILPFGLALSYTVYKKQNVLTGIIVHGLMNMLPLVLIIIEILK